MLYVVKTALAINTPVPQGVPSNNQTGHVWELGFLYNNKLVDDGCLFFDPAYPSGSPLSIDDYSSVGNISCGINKWLDSTPALALGNGLAHPDWLYTKESSVTFPSQTPSFMDAAWLNFDPLETDTPARNLYDPLSSNTSEGMARICIARHGGRPASSAPRNVSPGTVLPGTINMGFVDGHVEQVKLESLWTYNWHVNWVIPSPRPP